MSDDPLNQWDAYAMQDCIKGLTKERDNWKEEYISISKDLSLLLHENDELMTKLEVAVDALKGSRETILQLINSRYSEVEGTDEDWVGDIDDTIAKIKGEQL